MTGHCRLFLSFARRLHYDSTLLATGGTSRIGEVPLDALAGNTTLALLTESKLSSVVLTSQEQRAACGLDKQLRAH